MRNLPPRILVLSAFFTALASATAIVPFATPAMAKASAATFDAEFARIKQEMKDLWLEIHNFKPLPKYCLPPHDPMKLPHNSAMQVFGARTDALMAQFRATKQSLQDFLAGNHELEKELMLNGTSPRERNYWRDNKYQLEADRLQRKFNERDAELKAKPERNCAPTAPPKKVIEVIGGNPPPVDPPPPPPPPPPVDPLKGLTRPPIRAINFPRLENFYCSQAQKDAALALYPPEVAKVHANVADIDAYIASLKTRRGELKARGVEQHWLDSMDYEVRNAETEKASRLTNIQALETARGLVASTPVVDCATGEKKEIGSLPGFSFGAGVAYGDITIPKKPYLSLELGGDLFLGVVDYETRDNVLMVNGSVDYEFDCDRLPNLEIIGQPRRQRWMTSAELFGYDLSIFSQGRDIMTTTEGVGIPGTGDPMSSFPAGVFFANPAFNDVSDIGYRHHSDYRGGSISLGQKSTYDSFATYVGVGIGYNRLRTTDVLTGTVAGFLTDFRYETDVSTRNTNLFVKGGVEVPLDFWDQSLRYAGEFSGLRLTAGAEGRVNFLDAEGLDRLDLTGFVSDSQAMRIGENDTTFSFELSAGLKYTIPGVKGLDMSLDVRYRESDTHPVPTRSGQTGDVTRIGFEREEVFVGTLGTRFTF